MPTIESKRQKLRRQQQDAVRRAFTICNAKNPISFCGFFLLASFMIYYWQFINRPTDGSESLNYVPMSANTREGKGIRRINTEINSQKSQSFQQKITGFLNSAFFSNEQSEPAITIPEVIDTLKGFLSTYRARVMALPKKTSSEGVWNVYFELARDVLFPWDQEYLTRRMPKRRNDDSIFMSLATYRDVQCPGTLIDAYKKAKYPKSLYVGLVQQNCNENCVSGVLKNEKTKPVDPDPDCYALFCKSRVGRPHCRNGRVRLLQLDESESLGPYAARYFASKLWDGESWFMQIDSHSGFAKHWDEQSIDMLHRAPSEKPILSHYPPHIDEKLEKLRNKAPPRICLPNFSADDNQMIRLDSASDFDYQYTKVPRFGAFVAAGYYLAHSGILKEAPYDPFLPYIFMGEEIIMSSRYWTHGYDIFAPSHSVVTHDYGRKFTPKYWETLDRVFHQEGINEALADIPLSRVKHQIQYANYTRDRIPVESSLWGLEHYTMGTERSIWDYLKMAGIDPVRQRIIKGNVKWCALGLPPPFHGEKYNELYPKPDPKALEQLHIDYANPSINDDDDNDEDEDEDNEDDEDEDDDEDDEGSDDEDEGEDAR